MRIGLGLVLEGFNICLKSMVISYLARSIFSSRWAPLSSETEQINLIAIHPSRADLIRAL